jgi:enoyl-CoA hydratase
MTSVQLAPLDGGLALLQIDRPPANAIDLALLDELVGALERIPVDRPRALVIAGRAGFFSAGINLKTVPHYGPGEQRRMVSGINRMLLAAYGLELPVVAAVTGHAIGGGMLLTLCADYRVASTGGRYGIPGVKVGVPYPQAAIGVARAELAPHAARRLMLGNRLIDADECVRQGAFDEALAPTRVLDRALEMARELAALDTTMYSRTKLELRAAAVGAMRVAAESDPLLARRVDAGTGGGGGV